MTRLEKSFRKALGPVTPQNLQRQVQNLMVDGCGHKQNLAHKIQEKSRELRSRTRNDATLGKFSPCREGNERKKFGTLNRGCKNKAPCRPRKSLPHWRPLEDYSKLPFLLPQKAPRISGRVLIRRTTGDGDVGRIPSGRKWGAAWKERGAPSRIPRTRKKTNAKWWLLSDSGFLRQKGLVVLYIF